MPSCIYTSDDSFLSHFDLPELKAALLKKDVESAKNELIDHYRRRVETSWPSPGINRHNMIVKIDELSDLQLEKLDNNELVSNANAVLNYDISDAGISPIITDDNKIDWHFNPTGDPEWLWWLHRHHWWPILGLAYLRTGDERYAEAFAAQLTDWISENPPPLKKNEASPSWRLMEVALRMRVTWIPSFALFYPSPHFDNALKIKMLRSIYDHATFLKLFRSSLNHLLRESNGLASVGVFFHEFKDSKSWRKAALSRLDNELSVQVNTDGSHVEMSTGYQWLVIDEYEKAYKLLELSKYQLPKKDLLQWLAKMYGVLAKVIRPDGSFPQLNDGFIHWTVSRLVEAARMLGRDDYLYIGTQGETGIKPHFNSAAVRDAGYFVMRSGWQKDAMYLLFDAGPYGGYHGHEDKLNIEVFANGSPFIVDPGSYTYDASDPFRTYFVGSQGHNTLLVDGLSQVRRWDPRNLTPKPKIGKYGAWVSNKSFDYVSGTYNRNYAPFQRNRPTQISSVIEDVTHTRKILFIKPDYWLLLDDLKASAIHSYQQLFHTHPIIQVKQQADKVAVLQASDPASSLLLIPVTTDHLDLQCIRGSEDPIQGWYSNAPFQKQPATTLIYEKKNVLSPFFATLIYPLKTDMPKPRVAIKSIPVSGGEGVAFTIKHNSGADTIMFSDDNNLKEFGAYRSKAMVVCVRADKKGDIDLCEIRNPSNVKYH